MFRFTLTTEAGEVFSFTSPRMPRHWRSWLMRQCPYGTCFTGASFDRERI